MSHPVDTIPFSRPTPAEIDRVRMAIERNKAKRNERDEKVANAKKRAQQ